MEAFGIQITTEDADSSAKKIHLKASSTRGDSMDDDLQSTTADISFDMDQQSNAGGVASATQQSQAQVQFSQNRPATNGPQLPATPTPLLSPTFTGKTTGASYFDASSVVSGPAGPPVSPPESLAEGEVYEPKIAETANKSRSSFFGMFARRYFMLKQIAMGIAFFLNFILLFYQEGLEWSHEDQEPELPRRLAQAVTCCRVHIFETESAVRTSESGAGVAAAEDTILDAASALSNETNGAAEDEEPMEEILLHEYFPHMSHILQFVSFAHCLVSFALLVAYYQLKVPLIVFKREKDVARKLEFQGMWITEQPVENMIQAKLDSIVISSPSFPTNYWDKFVKKKVKDKYKEQFDEAELDRRLGLDKIGAPSDGIFSSLTNVDGRYFLWKMCVIISDRSFLYQLAYFGLSILGNWNPFFYAGHLIDMVISFPMLQTILKSVTHNGRQLLLTVMMVLVVVYLYTVLAFNFFRKFYVQSEEGEVDRKCHSMFQCFIFNLYAGVRAGGGIGDELESPYGDDKEVWRIMFDMSFHFFIIIILLAIMQGLIIDAFGELRDQQDTAQEKLESNCFICDLSKDFFDKLPRGFEHHTDKEHNLANYLFFLMHLIQKDETEYTGQETYVHTLYEERCWEFFPVGECFLKQYEDQLMVA